MATVITGIVKNRAHLASELTSDNPILLKGEFGIETDTYRVKVGDGVLSWNSLPYTGITINSGTVYPTDNLLGDEFYDTDLDSWFKWNGSVWTGI